MRTDNDYAELRAKWYEGEVDGKTLLDAIDQQREELKAVKRQCEAESIVAGSYRDERDELKQRIAQLESRAGVVPEGWKLVPLTPTPEMMAAWSAANVAELVAHGVDFSRTEISFAANYAALIAVAPPPTVAAPSAEGEE